MTGRASNVLFVCTHNSCRSVIAESILNRLGAPRFQAFSAGSHPSGKINAGALDLLQRHTYPIGHLRSKSWEEFANPGAVPIDFVFTVCDEAGGEACPLWTGAPMTVHWGVPDPSQVQGTDDEKRRAFDQTYDRLSGALSAFVALSPQDLRDKFRILQCLGGA